MKIKELRELEESKLQKALEDAKKELIQLGKSSKKRVVRRQIARILTIMNERKKGIEYKKEEKKKEEKKEEKHKEKEEKKKEVVKEKEEKAKKKIEKPKKKSLKTEKGRK
ncbi:MAG: uL29 family ribosomal protein [Candidatus Anstonellales archaeon]